MNIHIDMLVSICLILSINLMVLIKEVGNFLGPITFGYTIFSIMIVVVISLIYNFIPQ